MKFVGLFIVAICLISVSHAQMDMYFENEESSGDGATTPGNTNLPFDDEDTDDDEGSGAPVPGGKDDEEETDIEEIDVDEEPEVTGNNDKKVIIKEPKDMTKGTKGVLTEEEPEQKTVDEEELEDELKDPYATTATDNKLFLTAIIAGACIGLLFAICVIMLLVYRMRKKDEGSYALEYGLDGKKPQGNYEYTKGVAGGKEYFA